MNTSGEKTLIHGLMDAVNDAPECGIHYLHRDSTVGFHSYPQLLAEARQILGGLRLSGLQPGDRLILALSRNEDFVPTFWGCILGGIIPAPLPAPASFTTEGPLLERLHNVWQVLGQAPILLSDKPQGMAAGDPEATIPAERLLSLSAVRGAVSEKAVYPASAGDIAYIQFSSGSTGQPKGVMLSHRNILSNVRAIEQGLALSDADSGLSWMPLYHDMGLVGFHLVPLHFSIDHFLMETTDFIRKPLLWLDSLEKYRATITAAPNFSQAMILNHLRRSKGKSWDLSAVRTLFNGAEPISVDVMSSFIKEMSELGIRPEAMLPVYGLAEATLAVTFPPIAEEPRIEHLSRAELQTHGRAYSAETGDTSAIRFVHVGSALPGCEVRIVDDDETVLGDGRVGHIQVRGDNTTAGYYQDPDASREALSGDWLRTGDMGFLRKGSLVVTGRVKDILFVHGQNYFADDLERIARQIDGVQAGKLAACGCFDEHKGRDLLLLFLVSTDAQRDISRFLAVKKHLQRVAGVTVDAMVPLKSNELPRTSSGKLQRFKLRALYEQGSFDTVITQMSALIAKAESTQAKVAPRSVNEKLLHRLWCEELGLAPEAVGIDDHFADLGGESINVVAILSALESRHSIQLHSSVLEEHQTIAQLAAYLDKNPVSIRHSRGAGRTYFRG